MPDSNCERDPKSMLNFPLKPKCPKILSIFIQVFEPFGSLRNKEYISTTRKNKNKK